jgi:acylglycerol lipase
MTSAVSVSGQFRFTERAQPLRLVGAGRRVHGYTWRHSSPVATLVLLHGLQSHAQWFAGTPEWLLDRGLAVYAVDRRGSGSSPEGRGDVERYDEWLTEVADVVRAARADYPAVPIHLVGHCFGANVGLGSLLARRLDVASLVMLTPGLYILPDYSLLDKLRIGMCARFSPTARFRVPQDDDLFTRDPDVLAWIRSDSLGARMLTARCLVQIHRMGIWLRRNVGELGAPLLVLEATRDRISDNRRNRELLARVVRSRCRWVSFDAEHFLLTEPCRIQVLDELVRWASEEWRRW